MSTRNTPDRPAFVRQQYAFAAHIRNPEKNPGPEGIEERRMKIYRELFYNNVEGFIANTYPVLRQITPDDCWHAMIRDYFAHHVAHTPLFPEMPREFLKYLEHERKPQPDDPPFMLELAHYEWVELALSLLDEKMPDLERLSDLEAEEMTVAVTSFAEETRQKPMFQFIMDELMGNPEVDWIIDEHAQTILFATLLIMSECLDVALNGPKKHLLN